MANFNELSCSKIPSSLVNFREWVVEEEHPAIVSSDLERGFISSGQKFDKEMGGKFGKDGSMRMPVMLNDLDYNGIDYSLKKMAGEKEVAFDVFTSSDKPLKYSKLKSTLEAYATQDKEKQ